MSGTAGILDPFSEGGRAVLTLARRETPVATRRVLTADELMALPCEVVLPTMEKVPTEQRFSTDDREVILAGDSKRKRPVFFCWPHLQLEYQLRCSGGQQSQLGGLPKQVIAGEPVASDHHHRSGEGNRQGSGQEESLGRQRRRSFQAAHNIKRPGCSS